MIRQAALALILTLGLGGGPLAAEDTETVLAARHAAQALAEAAVALEESRAARDRVAALTRVVRAYEDGLAALRAGLRGAILREREITARFEARRAEIVQLTGALAGMEQNRGPLLLLHPAGPVGTARSGMLVADLTLAMQAEAARLSDDLRDVALLRSLQEGAVATLNAGLSGAQEARLELSRALAERGAVPGQDEAERQALAAILESADTLESFAEGLTWLTPGQDGGGEPAFDTARGALPWPVAGQVLRRFNEQDAAGVARPGVVVAAAPQALVTAPAAGTVRYAGPLLNYGNVIVLEPAPGYLLVMAGLEVLQAATGQVVAAGAPLGLMGGTWQNAADVLGWAQEGGGEAGQEALYIELRESGAPVDPAPWFAPERG